MVSAYSNGQMEESTMDNGLTIKWKAKAHLHGVMDVDTLDNIKMTRNTDKELSNGPMEENAVGPGRADSPRCGLAARRPRGHREVEKRPAHVHQNHGERLTHDLQCRVTLSWVEARTAMATRPGAPSSAFLFVVVLLSVFLFVCRRLPLRALLMKRLFRLRTDSGGSLYESCLARTREEEEEH